MEWGVVAFLLLFIGYELWENENPALDKYEIRANLPQNVKSLSILHISDLHNHKFGNNHNRIMRLINKDYNLILITGDLIDRRYPNIDVAINLIENISKISSGKIFFSTGNHENGTEKYKELKPKLIELGVTILDNETYDYRNINIVGISDPTEYKSINEKVEKNYLSEIKDNLQKLLKRDRYNLVLSHRPEYFDLYVKEKVDIVFTGHSHGGQMRIFNRGLYAPDQGFLVKYAGGKFERDSSIMINSRGLGNNFPFTKRVFNRPHLIEVNLINT